MAFEFYSFRTAEIFVSLYPWYYMPASIHKLLIHGSDIVKNAIVPIGQLSEMLRERITNTSENIEKIICEKCREFKIMKTYLII